MPKTRTSKNPTASRRKGSAPKGSSSARPAAKPPPADTIVTIRAADFGPVDLPRVPAFERVANDWSYVLRTRARWADKIEYRRALGKRALGDLKKLGVDVRLVRLLATKQHVEVEFHRAKAGKDARDALFEAACDVPWEYLLSAATREAGRYGPILVTRLLRNKTPNGIATDARRVLFVESGPGRLEDVYDFESERRRIQAALGAVEAADDPHDDLAAGSRRTITLSATHDVPSLKKLVQRPKEIAFDVIHVTGIDTHQASHCVDTLYDDLEQRHRAEYDKVVDAEGRVADGIVLRAANVPELPVDYKRFAEVLINPQSPPSLVTLNLYYSGARTARALVEQGARVALGFLDEIDDDVAELFFQAFYWKWAGPDGVFIPHALLDAWMETGEQAPGLHGTAVVMWFGSSVFDPAPLEPATTVHATVTSEQRTARRNRIEQTPVSKLLQVDLMLHDNGEINYSLLHNDRPLLRKLTLTKLVEEPLEDIAVFVELNVGGQNYPYRCTQLVLNEVQLALAPNICIPLTASLPRSLRERVHSTVYVKVTLGGRTAYEDTQRVTLIPVDEWLDDTRNNPWLPSFVLPRDPAVFRIVSSARRYLIGICDDPAAGFDGYQSEDDTADDPTAGIDRQVQAIWAAVVNDYRFQYINPPPAYSERTQRLRTPSDMLESNSGTCIDLALLLASCLEYVDIYPVIVLLEGHAFVGYWRSERYHEKFVLVSRTPGRVLRPGDELIDPNAIPPVDRYGWRLAGLHYDEVLAHVVAGELVLLEATMLTGAYGYAEAVAEGRANLKRREEFESLIDIRLARMASPPVTPLPITRASS